MWKNKVRVQDHTSRPGASSMQWMRRSRSPLGPSSLFSTTIQLDFISSSYKRCLLTSLCILCCRSMKFADPKPRLLSPDKPPSPPRPKGEAPMFAWGCCVRCTLNSSKLYIIIYDYSRIYKQEFWNINDLNIHECICKAISHSTKQNRRELTGGASSLASIVWNSNKIIMTTTFISISPLWINELRGLRQALSQIGSPSMKVE